MMNTLYIKEWDAWAPGLEEKNSWNLWKDGKLSIELSNKSPSLKHLPPVSRRRISQVTKMVIEVGHNLSNENKNPYVILSSQYGEINQQNKISRGILETGEVKPASFSLSVFNTPISLLSIHENITEPATIILSGENTLYNGLFSTIAQLKSEMDKDILLLFADELLPKDYESIANNIEPYCFGVIISSKKDSAALEVQYTLKKTPSKNKQPPLELLRWILNSNKTYNIGLGPSSIELTKC